MNRIDICITTMQRPQGLERMLFSIAAHRPEASIHIADQSKTVDLEHYERLGARLEGAGLRRRPTIHPLPYDCGASAARNHLVDSTPGEYKLVVDDDGLFTTETDLEKMARLLDTHPRVGIVGGVVIQNGQVRGVGSRLRREGASLYELKASGPYSVHEGIRFKQVDFLPNFALMRRELFEHIHWDPELKIAGEHLDFYLRLPQTPYIALVTPDVSGEHRPPPSDRSYRQLRMRGKFLRVMMEKHGLQRMEHAGGFVTEQLPDGRLSRKRPDRAPAGQAGS